ncbi:MAG: hypothetical protein QM661_15240 [Solimonas sp.]
MLLATARPATAATGATATATTARPRNRTARKADANAQQCGQQETFAHVSLLPFKKESTRRGATGASQPA